MSATLFPITVSRPLLAVLAAVPLLGTAAVASAGAATFCVPSPGAGTCAGDVVAATVAQAVDAADHAPGPDTVLIGPGLHDLGAGVEVREPNTELRGAGRDATVLTVQPLAPDDSSERTIVRGWMPRLSDLTLRLASAVLNDGETGRVVGATVYDGVVERVRVDAQGAAFGPGLNDGAGSALELRNGGMRDVEIDLGGAGDVAGVSAGGSFGNEPLVLEDVRVDGPFALRISPSADAGATPLVRARRLRLRGERPLSANGAVVEVADALIEALPHDPGDETAIDAAVQLAAPWDAGRVSELRLDRVTLVRAGAASAVRQSAFAVEGGAAAAPTTLHVRHTVVHGFDHTLLHNADGGPIVARFEHSLVDTRPEARVRHPESAGTGAPTVLAGDNRGGDPLFLDASGRDYRLAASSPAIDIGGEELVAGGSLDLAGAPRPSDGDGDGVVAADAGAFEHIVQSGADGGGNAGGGGRDGADGDGQSGPLCCQRPPDRAPGLQRLAATPSRLVHGGRGAIRLRFRLSEDATVRIRVERRAGRRWLRAGALAPVRLRAGDRSVRVTGRIGRHVLSTGHYRAVLVAVDAAGHRSAPKRVGFAIVSARGARRR